jgi:hypothetical protein
MAVFGAVGGTAGWLHKSESSQSNKSDISVNRTLQVAKPAIGRPLLTLLAVATAPRARRAAPA